MPEQTSATKVKRQPKKQPVQAPDTHLNASAPQAEMLASPIETYSPQQIIQLQRTLGNKAVGDLIRRQKAAAEPVIQRDVAAAPAPSSSKVRLRTSARVIQPLFGFGKKKTPASPVAAATPAPVISAPKEAPKGLLPAPAVLDSNIKATAEQQKNPLLALKTYREAVGVHLREAKRDKFKIDRYKTFLEADFIYLKTNVPILESEETALEKREASLTNATTKQAKADKKKLVEQRAKLNERKMKVGENLPDALTNATVRIKKAYNAKTVADAEVPVVEYAYDELVKMRHDDLEGTKSGKLFGHGNPYERLAFYQKKLDMAVMIANSDQVSIKANNTNRRDIPKYTALVAKHKKRISFIEKATEDLKKAEMLRGQAKLSEGYMGLKRKELKAAKAEVKVTKRNIQIEKHLASKVGTAALGFALSTATVGLVELEQNKTDGGYTSKREVVTIVDTWKRDWAALKAVWTARPYGKMTALHLFFQGLGTLILKPLRKMFTAAALIFAGLALIPPITAIMGAISAFCTLVTLGLVAAKIALDAVLATWSSLTLALNKNAHNTDLLRGQAAGQATDVLAGGVAIGAAFAVPAIANAFGGKYLGPLDNVQSGKAIGDYLPGGAGGNTLGDQATVLAPKVGSTVGLTVAEKVVGAGLEMESAGAGARGVFKTRQEQAMAHGQTPAENYMEERDTKLLGALIHPRSGKRAKAPRIVDQYHGAKRAGDEARSMEAAAKAAPQIDPRALAAAGPDKELEKQSLVRQAATRNIGDKAKSQVAAFIGPIQEVAGQGSEIAAGSKAAEKGIAGATPEQGVQPVDSTNAGAAQSNIGAAKEIIQQILEVAHEAPAAVDEALAPAPKPA